MKKKTLNIIFFNSFYCNLHEHNKVEQFVGLSFEINRNHWKMVGLGNGREMLGTKIPSNWNVI